jgi:hypothetical protein
VTEVSAWAKLSGAATFVASKVNATTLLKKMGFKCLQFIDFLLQVCGRNFDPQARIVEDCAIASL